MSTLQLDAQPRALIGRKVKQLRRQGLVPIIVYGAVDEPVALQVQERSLERTLQAGGGSQLVQLQVEGGSAHNVLVRDLQRHPVRRSILHADFYAINMQEKQQVAIPLVSINTPATLVGGLMVLQSLDAVEIEALPSDIPGTIEVDVTELTLEKDLTVADLLAIEGVEFVSDPEESIFTMVASRITEESVDALDDDIALADGEAVTEGEEDDSDDDDGE